LSVSAPFPQDGDDGDDDDDDDGDVPLSGPVGGGLARSASLTTWLVVAANAAALLCAWLLLRAAGPAKASDGGGRSDVVMVGCVGRLKNNRLKRIEILDLMCVCLASMPCTRVCVLSATWGPCCSWWDAWVPPTASGNGERCEARRVLSSTRLLRASPMCLLP